MKIYKLEDESRLDELIELIATGLGQTTREYWQWRLFSDACPVRSEAFAAEDDAGRLVGFSSILPAAYCGGAYSGVQLCDRIVHPEFRGRGIMGMMYRYTYDMLRQQKIDFLYAFPNDNSYPILMRYGFDDLGGIGSWETGKALAFSRAEPADAKDGGLEYRFSDTCPISRFPEQRPDRMLRTPEYMRWKYDLKPGADYTWLTVRRGGELAGYFVYALTRGRLRTAVTVYDWAWYSGESDGFVRAVRLLHRQGNFVSVWGRYGGDDAALLTAAGMKQTAGTARLIMKKVSEKGYPDALTLTRIDTDY